MNIVDDALDFLLFIFFLGICLAVAFGIVIPIVYDQNDLSSQTLADKTSPTIKGLELDTTYDGTLSKFDVVLMSQIQDYDMPNPKHYKVENPTNGSLVDVDIEQLKANYRSDYNLDKYGDEIKNALVSDNTLTGKYKIFYDYGTSAGKEDDFYIIKKVN